MSRRDSKYIHGTDPDEQRRLSTLNDILNERSLHGIGIHLGDRILDVGSGLGQLTRAMARKTGSDGAVIGIEENTEQIEEARRQAVEAGEQDLIEIRQGSAYELPLTDDEWGTFDVVHTRFLLEHVADPEAVVGEMFRAARPGGRVVLEDDDHDVLRIWPPVPGFDELWRGYIESYRVLGFDPFVGRRLVTLLRDAGAISTRNDWKFFGGCHGEQMFEDLVANFIGIVDGARATLLSATSLDEAALDRELEVFLEWSKKPDASMWYGTFWAEGVRAESDSRRTRDSGETVHPPRTSTVTEAPSRSLDKFESLRFLADSARDLNSSLKLSEVYEKIAERVHQFLDYHLFCVMLWDEQTQLLEFNHSVCFGQAIPMDGGFPLGHGLSGTAAIERRCIRVDNVLEDARYIRHRHPEVEIRSELAVPLIVRERMIGVLDLESTEFGAFTEEHERLMDALSRHIAIAVDNAQLYERVLADDQRKEYELATARAIQKELLPSVPDITGVDLGVAYSAATALAGDFYDFLPLEGDRLAFAVGDVAGKSAPAALYGSLAVGILRGQALRRIHEPHGMLKRMNEQLGGMDIEERFVTMVYGVLDGQSRELVFSNAGFPYPYLVRDGEIRLIEKSGVPLGLFIETTYESTTVALRSGDVLAFCSDGFIDCENESGQPFGEKRLTKLILECAGLHPQKLATELIDRTDRHAGSAQHTDDRTAVIIRVS